MAARQRGAAVWEPSAEAGIEAPRLRRLEARLQGHLALSTAACYGKRCQVPTGTYAVCISCKG